MPRRVAAGTTWAAPLVERQSACVLHRPSRRAPSRPPESVLCRMQRRIRTKWHRPALYFPANLVQLPRLLSRVIATPFGKVHISTPIIYVIDDKPRHGRHVAVPGPAGVVRMAVPTRSIENRSNLRTYVCSCLKCLRLINCRVSLRRSEKLGDDKKRDHNDCQPLQRFPNPPHTSPLVLPD